MKSVCLLLLAGASAGATSFSPYYDLTFDTPDQVVGQVVKTGADPKHVSSVIFGAPRVVSSFEALGAQPLLFTSVGQTPLGTGYYYTQIGLNLTDFTARQFELSFDFCDVGSEHFFTVLFDTPHVRNFIFENSRVYFENPQFPRTTIAAYASGVAQHIRIGVDYDLNRWQFFRNDQLLAQGAFNPSGVLASIRFNYAAAGPDISGTAIDNVRVMVVPEPGFGFWGLLGWWGWQRTRRMQTS